jgi:hypothetical protein
MRNFTIAGVTGTPLPFITTGDYKFVFTITDSGEFDKIVLQMNVTIFFRGMSLSIASL